MKKAFTLIELLVVIAIIAILAAILFPVFAQAKAAAKNTASLSNVKQITLSSQMYAGDTDDHLPVAVYAEGAGYTGTWHTWAWDVNPYMKNFDIMYSPAGGPHATSGWMTIFTQPQYNWIANWQWFAQYGYNASYMNYSATCDQIQSIDSNPFNAPISATQAASPAETIEFAETGRDAPDDNVGAELVYGPGGFNSDDVCTYDDWGKAPNIYTGLNVVANAEKTQAGLVRPRSAGGANVSFLDGHAKTMKLGSLANGTTWQIGQAEGTSIIVDRTKYLWDLQ